MPADADDLAGVQTGLADRVAHLHDEIVAAGDLQPGAQDVAHIDDLHHLRLDRVGALGHHLGLELDPFGADRHGRALTPLADVHGGGVDHPAPVQPHQRLVSVQLLDRAGQGVVLSDEACDEAVLGALVEVGRRGQLLDAPVVEDRDAVRHGQGLALVMGHIDDGDSKFLVQMLDFELHMLAKLLVQGAKRLVHQHQFGVEDQGAGQGDPLLLPAGQLRRTPVRELAHLHHVQRAGDARLAFVLAHPADLQRKGQVLSDGHVRKQRIVLEHHADPALVRRHLVDWTPAKTDLSVRRGFEARQHHQAGRLAGTGRPQHR